MQVNVCKFIQLGKSDERRGQLKFNTSGFIAETLDQIKNVIYSFW